MPSYEHILKVGKKEVGRITLTLPVADRDAVRVVRSPLPASVHVPAGPGENPTLRQLHRMEQRMGGPEFHRRLGHAPETVKRVWKDHDRRHAKTKDD